MIGADLFGAVAALAIAVALQGTAWQMLLQPWWQIPLILVTVIGCAAAFGLYSAVIRYIAIRASFKIVTAAVCTAVLLASAGLFLSAPLLNPALIANFSVVLILALAAARILPRRILGAGSDADAKRVLIYGAGETGVQLAQTLAADRRRRVVAFVDDRQDLIGSNVIDLPVCSADAIPALVDRRRISYVLLALPSATRQRRQAVLSSLEPLPVTVKTVPALSDILSGEAQVSDIRNLDIEDLLGRDPVPPDEALLHLSIDGQAVLVTGAGGSIGAELCRQIVALNPAHLILFDSSESSLFHINYELSQWAKKTQTDVPITAVLGNVLDHGLMAATIRRFAVDTLYHAAAYKHVPLVEQNIRAGFRNNVIGTQNVAEAARANGVHRFILISTDKAVRPTNVMGATKRVAEQIIQAQAAQIGRNGGKGCIFSMVRFGNVLGSSGSVVPRFREQIGNGGPVTVTHPEITRYFMTIPESAQLVIQAGAMARGGEVFVLDMGEPVRIADLARRMIRLAGHTVRDQANPAGDIELAFTGLRPGEKLYEELLIASSSAATGHSKIGCAEETALAWPELEPLIQEMDRAASRYQRGQLKQLLQRAVPEYTPEASDHDAITDLGDEDHHTATKPDHSNVAPLQ